MYYHAQRHHLGRLHLLLEVVVVMVGCHWTRFNTPTRTPPHTHTHTRETDRRTDGDGHAAMTEKQNVYLRWEFLSGWAVFRFFWVFCGQRVFFNVLIKLPKKPKKNSQKKPKKITPKQSTDCMSDTTHTHTHTYTYIYIYIHIPPYCNPPLKSPP